MAAKINIGSDVFKVSWLINVDIRFEVKPNSVMNIFNLGFKSECADEINVGNVLEHLPKNRLNDALKECHRILQPGGVLYITVPLVDSAYQCLKNNIIDYAQFRAIIAGEDSGHNMHQCGFMSDDVNDLLIQNGFEPHNLELQGFPYLVVSNVRNPKVDPWQAGYKGVKC